MTDTKLTNAAGGTIYLRGQTWWVYYGYRGKRYRESSGSTKVADAKRLLKKRLAEMGAGQLIGPRSERLMFTDLADMIRADYKVNERRSTRRLETSLAHLSGYFGLNRAIDITTDRVDRYIVHRQGEGAAASSISKELGTLKRSFNLAVRAKRLATRPHIPGIAVENTREDFFSEADLERVITELPAYLRPVIRFATLTGWRKSEVLDLRWSAVDFNAGEVRLAPGTTKNKDGRTFPFAALPPWRAYSKNSEISPEGWSARWASSSHTYSTKTGSRSGAWTARGEELGSVPAWMERASTTSGARQPGR